MDKDIYDAIKQVVKDLILPELAKIQADIQQIKEQQNPRWAPASTVSPSPSIPPRSPESSAYLDAICAEIGEMGERRAAEWARRKAKDPNAKASIFGQIDVKKRQAKKTYS